MVSPIDMFEVFFSSLLVYKEVNYCLSKQAKRLGLDLTELLVLWIVARFGETTMLEIARLISLPKQEISSVLDSLEADGLVKKIYPDESRKRLIMATPRGIELIDEIPTCSKAECSFRKLDSEKMEGFMDQARQLLCAFRGSELVDRLKP